MCIILNYGKGRIDGDMLETNDEEIVEALQMDAVIIIIIVIETRLNIVMSSMSIH